MFYREAVRRVRRSLTSVMCQVTNHLSIDFACLSPINQGPVIWVFSTDQRSCVLPVSGHPLDRRE